MADIWLEANAHGSFYSAAIRCGPFWTSPTVGYIIYINSTYDLVYNKTVDGGANWAGQTNIKTAWVFSVDCWADWQTAGDAGTKIHIAYMNTTSDEVRYVYLDTNTDTVGGDDLIETCQGTGAMSANTSKLFTGISITKTRGGNIAVAFFYTDTGYARHYNFYTSPDADTWTNKTTPWEAVMDRILLFPGNEADNQDIWAAFWDISENELSLKTYDDSGNSWSEQLISGSMTEAFEYLNMDGAIRLSDGHFIFAAWNLFDLATADLMVWDINGAGSITAKTNILTDSAESALVSILINQVNDDIYAAYVRGTAMNSLVKVFYQKSVDGGTNWGGETALQANAEDDTKWVSSGAMKAAWGGKFMPYWFNDDEKDLFTSDDNSVSIPSSAVVRIPRPGVVNFQDPAIV